MQQGRNFLRKITTKLWFIQKSIFKIFLFNLFSSKCIKHIVCTDDTICMYCCSTYRTTIICWFLQLCFYSFDSLIWKGHQNIWLYIYWDLWLFQVDSYMLLSHIQQQYIEISLHSPPWLCRRQSFSPRKWNSLITFDCETKIVHPMFRAQFAIHVKNENLQRPYKKYFSKRKPLVY